jgi:hypothetical protein
MVSMQPDALTGKLTIFHLRDLAALCGEFFFSGG